MPQMQGGKGEAVVSYREPLSNTADGVSLAFPKGKQNDEFNN
jgi:hypothetical protein